MLLLGEQNFAANDHDSFDANGLVMVTLRQATSAFQKDADPEEVIAVPVRLRRSQRGFSPGGDLISLRLGPAPE